MGIDVYLHWEGQTEDQKNAQITGFDVTAGKVGYLRESYGGDPYATKVLMPESWFDAKDPAQHARASQWSGIELDLEKSAARGVQWLYEDNGSHKGVHIPAELLQERLAAALRACADRYSIQISDSEIAFMAKQMKLPVRLATLAKKGEEESWKPEALKSYIDFVRLARNLEKKGIQPYIVNSY